jgi:CelD/BcsL family acetyltransferase involved in cellulose biosynthesis
MIRFLGHDQGDQLGPICAPEDLPRACQALRTALRTSRWAWDLFLGETVPGDAGLRQAIGGERLRREGSPVVRFGVSTWEELLARWSPNFRSQVRSRERRLAREGELRFRLSDGPEQLADDLDLLFRLHGARWGGQVTRFARSRTFHRAFSKIGQEHGWIRLWFLELDGRPVAGWYGFRFQGVESYYQAGRDPTALHGSVGFVLLAQTVRSALEDGMREYRFLRGGEEYKYRFASDDVGLETVILARGTRGRAAMAVGLAAGRSRRARGILRRVL